MNVKLDKIASLSFAKVQYYTLTIAGRSKPEFRDFLDRMRSEPKYHAQVGQIIHFIHEIGKKHGAHIHHFKHEREAEALPPPYYIQPGNPNKYGLRLYCIRLTPEIVILVNGDLKTHDKPDQCENCRGHFRLANALARKINAAIRDGWIQLDGKEIYLDDDFELEI